MLKISLILSTLNLLRLMNQEIAITNLRISSERKIMLLILMFLTLMAVLSVEKLVI
ncbi:hypothetical protein LINGRAHAP2_LOCUS24208 [Linum grandiflorum]